MLHHQRTKFGDQRVLDPSPQSDPHQFLGRGQAQLTDAVDGRHSRQGTVQLRERVPSPQGQGSTQVGLGHDQIPQFQAIDAIGNETAEADRIDRAFWHLQVGMTAFDPQTLTEDGSQGAQECGRLPRRAAVLIRPHHTAQAGDADRLIDVRHQPAHGSGRCAGRNPDMTARPRESQRTENIEEHMLTVGRSPLPVSSTNRSREKPVTRGSLDAMLAGWDPVKTRVTVIKMRHSSAVGNAPLPAVDHVRTPITLSVLGPVEVRSTDTTSRPAAGRQRRMLTVLAVATANDRSLGADELIDAVYGDDPPLRARRSLSTELWRCRQLLGPEAIQSEDAGYRIDQRLVDIDLVRFARGLESGRAATEAGQFEAAERHLVAALALWRGTPLSEWDDHPVGRAAIARLEELLLGGTEDLAEALSGLGRHPEAVSLLTTVTREHPAREHAWALLIESHHALDDRRRAATALDSVRRTLAEHGVDLGAELRAVREHLNDAGANRAAPAPPSPPVTRPRPDDAGLLGRSDSVRLALTATEAALASGSPEAVVISGEAGIGKTALAERVLAACAQNSPAASTWALSCDDRLTLPFATLRPILRQHAAAAGVVLPGWLQRDAELPNSADLAALIDELVAIVAQCAAALGGIVMLVDDGQWASRELLEVLLALLARPAPTPLAIVVTIRDPAAPDSVDGGPTTNLLQELRHRATHHIRLTGLGPEQVREFLGSEVSDAEAERVHHLTGGNPLYLHHLALAADGTVMRSATLTDALDQRIDSLPLDVLRVVELAAAIGTRFDARVLTSAASQPPFGLAPDAVFDALDLAQRWGVLAQPRQYDTAFVHALVRDRLYERSPYRQRTMSHALIVEALTRLTGPDAPAPDLLADHSRRAWPVCPTVEVVARLADAGQSANSQLAFDEAQRYFQMALDLIAMDPAFIDDERRDDLLAALGQAAAAAGNPTRARESYESLRKHGIHQVRPLTALRGALGSIWTYAHERIDTRVVDHLADAIDGVLGTPVSPDPDEIELLRDAMAALHAYRPDAERARRPAALARGPRFRTPLLTALWEQETIPHARKIAEDLLVAPDADHLGARIRRWASGIASGTRSFADEPTAIWASAGSRPAQWEAIVWQIVTTMVQGDFPRALRLIDDAEQHVGRVNNAVDSAARHAQLLGQRMWIALQSADGDALLTAARANKPQYSTRRPIMRSAAALRHIALGDIEAAWAACDRLVDEFGSGLVAAREVHASVVSLSNACLWLQHDRGIALCRELLAPHEGEHVLFYLVQYWGSVNHHLGRLALQQGDLDASVQHLTGAIADHERVGARVLGAQSHRFLASALWHRNGANDRTTADHHRAHALTEARTMGVHDITQQPWPPAEPFDRRRL
jgi:DNA-binding SARP family transcriptional activator